MLSLNPFLPYNTEDTQAIDLPYFTNNPLDIPFDPLNLQQDYLSDLNNTDLYLFHNENLSTAFNLPIVESSEEINPFELSFYNTNSSPQNLPTFMPNNTASSQISSYNNTKVASIIEKPKFSKKRSNLDHEKILAKNRIAASKCRQKKKEMLKKQEEETQAMELENEYLSNQVHELKNEIINIKMLLSAHHDCALNTST